MNWKHDAISLATNIVFCHSVTPNLIANLRYFIAVPTSESPRANENETNLEIYARASGVLRTV